MRFFFFWENDFWNNDFLENAWLLESRKVLIFYVKYFIVRICSQKMNFEKKMSFVLTVVKHGL